MTSAVVLESLGAKEELLRYLEGRFAGWLRQNREQGTGIGLMWPNEEEGLRMGEHLAEMTRCAEIFAVEPLMTAVVKMAAEDLPAEAAFLPDDLPTELGLLFLGEPLPLPVANPQTVAGLDAIVWHATATDVILAGWSSIVSLDKAFPTHRVPVAIGKVKFEEPIRGFVDPQDTSPVMADGLTLALVHALAAMRIMQQPYAGQVRERAPRAAARRLARQDAKSDVTVISYRRTAAHSATADDGTPGQQLDHRVLVRGHWRHQHYKTPDGAWAAKQIYVGPYIRGPEHGPLIISQKVNDLRR